MKLRLLTTALVALAGAFITQSANAQIYSAVSEDMILSFSDGSLNDIQVDLGQLSQFTGASPSFSLNVDADLVAQYGANWFTSSTIEWSVAGLNNSGAVQDGFNTKSVFVTNDTGTAFTAQSGSSLSGSNVGQLYIVPTSPSPTAGIGANTDIVAPGATDSYSNANATGGFNKFGATQNTFGLGAPSTLQLDEMGAGSSSLAAGSTTLVTTGVFSINSAGIISFGSAIPEPSTYALMLVGALLLAFQVNRRKSSASRL